MALLGLATGGLFALASAPEDSVHNLGHFTHLFVDDSLLLSRVNLSLSLNTPVVDPEPIVGPDQPWELASGSVRPSPHPTTTLLLPERRQSGVTAAQPGPDPSPHPIHFHHSAPPRPAGRLVGQRPAARRGRRALAHVVPAANERVGHADRLHPCERLRGVA